MINPIASANASKAVLATKSKNNHFIIFTKDTTAVFDSVINLLKF